MTSERKALFGFSALLALAGCDQFAPKPKDDSLQKQQNEVAAVQARVDLAIAKADIDAIEFQQFLHDNTQKAIQNANVAKNYGESKRLSDQLEEIEKEQDKVIDRVARHRCNR